MKIALCLSGHVRSKPIKFAHRWKRYLLDIADVDVFIHTWSKRGAWPAARSTDYGNLLCEEDLYHEWDQTKLLKEYNPVKFVVESQAKIESVIDTNLLLHRMKSLDINGGALIDRYYKMWHKIQKCYNLIEPHRYDIVIKSRLDGCITSPFDFSKISAGNIIATKYPSSDNEESINDVVIAGTQTDMRIITNIVDFFDVGYHLMNPNDYLNPHKFLETYIKLNHINYTFLPMEWTRE